MMRIKIALFLFPIICIAPHLSFSQTTEPQRFHIGPFVDFSLDYHTANFQHLPGIPNCCPQFTGGVGAGSAYGVTMDMPIDSGWAMGVNIASASLGATLSHDETTALQVNGALTQGTFQHTIDATLTMISVEPMLAYSITSRWTAMAGVSFGFMQTANYAQQEIISSPGGATFVDANGNDTHSRIRGQSSGTLPGSAATRVAPFVGVRYALPLNRNGTLLLQPEAQLGIGVTNVVQNLSWLAHTLRFGATLVFAPQRYNDASRTREHIDTLRMESPGIDSQIVIAGFPVERETITFEGTTRVTTQIFERTDTLLLPVPLPSALLSPSALPVRMPEASSPMPRAPSVTVEACGTTAHDPHADVRMIVEESYAEVINPLLPYIFFEENSDTIPLRYFFLTSADTAAFNVAHINSADRLATYHHLLNIIGRRLRDDPATTATLTGCNCDRGAERGNIDLSRRRAEAVKKYFHDVWGVDERRIQVHMRSLPEKAANTDTDDGRAENRRVEIFCNNESILAPLLTRDTIHSVDPPVVCFHPAGGTANAHGKYFLTIAQHGTIIKKFSGDGDVPQTLDWHADHEQQAIPRNDEPLQCTLRTIDTSGREAISRYELPLAQRIDTLPRVDHRGGKNIARFRLFLYDVRGSELPPYNAPVMRYIARALTSGAVVRIAGFTDRLGDAEYNQKLSGQRARRAASALHLGASAIIEGKGISSLYDSALPEGRLYTRTVEVEVETTVK